MTSNINMQRRADVKEWPADHLYRI